MWMTFQTCLCPMIKICRGLFLYKNLRITARGKYDWHVEDSPPNLTLGRVGQGVQCSLGPARRHEWSKDPSLGNLILERRRIRQPRRCNSKFHPVRHERSETIITESGESCAKHNEHKSIRYRNVIWQSLAKTPSALHSQGSAGSGPGIIHVPAW